MTHDPASVPWSEERAWLHDLLIRDGRSEDLVELLIGSLDRWAARSTAHQALYAVPVLVAAAEHGVRAVHAGPMPRERAIAVSVAWRLLRVSAKLFDDVEDGDARGREAETINVALGLLFAAELTVERLSVCGLARDRVWQARGMLTRACFHATEGQQRDAAGYGGDDPDAWLETATAKSGALLGLACALGAIAGGAPDARVQAWQDFGAHLGLLLQVADDYNGVWGAAGPGDLAAGRPTLPVAYALSVAD